ncbi:MAG: hypothetical protein ACLRMW_18525, partial [[Clostridium] symbiosum]
PGPLRTLIVSSLKGGGNLVAATTYCRHLPAPPCANKTTVSPSPASYAAPPGRKTHNPIPPPRPLACGGVLTCLINLHTVMRKSVA